MPDPDQDYQNALHYTVFPRKVHGTDGSVEWHWGELFPRVGFIVANLCWRSRRRWSRDVTRERIKE